MAFRHFALLLLFPALALSQQYAGDKITNSLPAATGAEIAFFNVKDPNGDDTTLINYYSRPGGNRIDPDNVKRAIVIMTGQLRDPWVYFGSIYSALDDAAELDSEISEDNVAILAPYWANEEDAGTGYPATNGASTTKALVWEGKLWSNGDDSVYPSGQSVSSFDALDQILQYFDNKDEFPNLNEIIVAGHSRGAQMVQRYAAVGKELNLETPLVYWVANPNSFMWWSPARPLSTDDCPIYNNWPEGLDSYDISYNSDFVNGNSPDALKSIYDSRDIAYARGLNDHGDLSDNCSPYTAGADRGLRNAAYMEAWNPNSDDTVDYNSGIGHNAPKMILAESGLRRLFVDNFDGDNSRAADFGPRQVDGDDPHPNAS